MAINRWDPFRDLAELQGEIDRVLGSTFSRRGKETTVGSWLPPVDVKEEEEEFVLFVDLPGVDEKAVEITVVGDQLTIKGERKAPEEGENFLRQERVFGPFHRSFLLRMPVEVDKVSATYKNGVLEIHLPKSSAAKPRKVSVQVE
ncbi:MAG TPA: Hsp20/alpha crystallin family protein [Candidatus Atribacteria bacterium]|nr:Hsp20/alpha crystallin family protein [Candidatus Atribacteria bacterium]